jgi:polysaccharide deacetylase family protein (PEP-CTERM system associated)
MSAVVNAMTIDVEDYFHVSVFDGLLNRSEWPRLECRVEANTNRLLELFAETGVTATFFVLGWVAERIPRLVSQIGAAGHEIASHGSAHRLIYDQTRAAFREDVRRSKHVLEDSAGVEVQGFRAPSYSVTPRTLWALDILIEEGYRYDSSIFPIHHDRYGIPESARHPFSVTRPAGSLIEVPASTIRWGPLNLPVGGGGYFRLLPYGWTQWGINRLNHREGMPAVFYLHPWEIDPDQPRLPAGRLGRIRHYRNLDKTEDRLRALLRDFRFGPMRALVDQLTSVMPQLPTLSRDSLPYLW